MVNLIQIKSAPLLVTRTRRARVLGADLQAERLGHAGTFLPLQGPK
jgi:hypothetical protein